LSIFLAAVGLFLPAGGAAVVVGSLSLASGLASLPPADKKPYLQVDDGPYPQGIIRNAEYALKDLRDMVFDLDDTISAGLDRDLNGTDRFGSPNLKVAPRPSPRARTGTSTSRTPTGSRRTRSSCRSSSSPGPATTTYPAPRTSTTRHCPVWTPVPCLTR